jgi:hypothetical protein
MKKMFAKNGLIGLAAQCQAINLFSGKSEYNSTPDRTAGIPTFAIPLQMILNTPSRIKVAKGSAVFYCTRSGNSLFC